MKSSQLGHLFFLSYKAILLYKWLFDRIKLHSPLHLSAFKVLRKTMFTKAEKSIIPFF